jgi:hypothetical protein
MSEVYEMIDHQILLGTFLLIGWILIAYFPPEPRPMPDDFPTFKRIPMPDIKPSKDYVCIHALWRSTCHTCDDVHIKRYEEAFPEDQVIRLGGRRTHIIKRPVK